MIIPYNTDAPIYHFPYVSIGIIVVNVLMFCGTTAMVVDQEDFDRISWLILEFNQINPIQWITSSFMHADFMHLFGNMIFLWSFGLIVEGKLGAFRFLGLYLLIAALHGALVQIPMYLIESVSPGALGASGVIFGIMAIAVVWAPENELSCVVFFRFIPHTFEMKVSAFAGIYFVLQVVFFLISGPQMSSELLHLIGLAVGLPIGIAMVKLHWIDCEGWDIFNVLEGNTGLIQNEMDESSPMSSLGKSAEPEVTIADERDQAVTVLREAIASNQNGAVVALFDKYRVLLGHGDYLNSKDVLSIVSAMHQLQQWNESIPLMVLLLRREGQRAYSVRLTLAQILVRKDQRPQQALAVLENLPANLPPAETKLRRSIEQLAHQQIAEGALETQIEDW